jgi:DNA-binding LytR/AlgR family response regulator
MSQKIKCVLVDDEPSVHMIIEDLCKSSAYVELVAKFTCPEEFMRARPSLDFDLCLLDIVMGPMNGFSVAQSLKDKLVTFITGGWGKVPEALGINPVDVLLKPILRERFESSMEKTYYLMLGKRTENIPGKTKSSELFWVAELLGKVKLSLSEIVYVKTDEVDHRNKQIWMADGKKYTLMNYSLQEIMNLAPQLVQVNISELLSIDCFDYIERDVIVLKNVIEEVNKPRKVKLGRAYKKKFYEQFAATN